MNISQLTTFLTLASKEHDAQGAKVVDSGVIDELEQELGLVLFDRLPEGMKLSSQGEALLEQAATVVREAEALTNLARELHGEVSGRLRLGLPASLESSLAPELGRLLAEEFPALEVDSLAAKESSDLLGRLQSGEIDGVVLFGDVQHGEDVVVQSLLDFSLLVVGPARWEAELQQADWPALVALPWVWPSPDCPWSVVVEEIFSCRGSYPTAIARPGDRASRNDLIWAGAGIGFMEEKEAEIVGEAGELAAWPLEKVPARLSLCFLQHRHGEAAIQAALTMCQRLSWVRLP